MTALLLGILSCLGSFKLWFQQKCIPADNMAYFPSPLIQTLGFDFPLCGRDKAAILSSELLDERFANKHLTDRNRHPIAVIAGSPGVGKTRLLLALPGILNSLIEQRKYNMNNFIPIIFTYNNGNPVCDLDYSLPIDCVLGLRILHAFSKSPQRFVEFARNVPENVLKSVTLESTLNEIVSYVNENSTINKPTKDKIQGVYLGLDEFNRLIEERGDVVDIYHLNKVYIYITLIYH